MGTLNSALSKNGVVFRAEYLFVFFALILVSNHQHIIAQPRSNLDMLAEACDDLVQQQVLDSLTLSSAVQITPLDDNPSNWFVEDCLTRKLHQAGATVYLKADSDKATRADTSANLKLEFKTVAIGVAYHEQEDQRLQRRVVLELFVRVTDSQSGRLLFSASPRKHVVDYIDADDVARIEDSELAFARGTVIREERPPKLLRPVVVSAAAGLIVYLFYALRSR